MTKQIMKLLALLSVATLPSWAMGSTFARLDGSLRKIEEPPCMKPKNECEADRAKVQAMDARDKAVKAMRRAREAQDKVDADRVGGNLCNNC